jgi:hypothetical protein
MMIWSLLVLVGILGLDLIHRKGLFERRADVSASRSGLPVLRMGDGLIPDTATRHHAVYFRLRFWNEGGGAITPEVRVTRLMIGEDDPQDAPFAAQLPLILPWSSLSTPPSLTRQHTAGETVGVIGGLSWLDKGDGTGFPIYPPLLYVAGAAHNPEIGQTEEKVFVKVQAFVPGQPQVPTIEKWFWIQIAKDESDRYRVLDGHPDEAPTPKAPKSTSTEKMTDNNKTSENEQIESDLRHRIAQRLADIPLRGCEIEIIVLILRDAIRSLDEVPFIGMQPGNSAADVQFKGKRRQSSEGIGEQMWEMPTKFRAYCSDGAILSDQTLDTLIDLHDRIMALRREVYDDYHPPSLPQN